MDELEWKTGQMKLIALRKKKLPEMVTVWKGGHGNEVDALMKQQRRRWPD